MCFEPFGYLKGHINACISELHVFPSIGQPPTRLQPISYQSLVLVFTHHFHFGQSFMLLFHCFCLLGTFFLLLSFRLFPFIFFLSFVMHSIHSLHWSTHVQCMHFRLCVHVGAPLNAFPHTLRQFYRREMNKNMLRFSWLKSLYGWKSFIRYDLKIITSIAPPTTTHTHAHTRHVSISTSISKQWKVAHDVLHYALYNW